MAGATSERELFLKKSQFTCHDDDGESGPRAHSVYVSSPVKYQRSSRREWHSDSILHAEVTEERRAWNKRDRPRQLTSWGGPVGAKWFIESGGQWKGKRLAKKALAATAALQHLLLLRVGARSPRIWQKHRIRLARNCIKPQISLSRMPLRLNFISCLLRGRWDFLLTAFWHNIRHCARTLFCSTAYTTAKEEKTYV